MTQSSSDKSSWNLKMTDFAKRTENPLRKVWEGGNIIPNSAKEMITLQIGKYIITTICLIGIN